MARKTVQLATFILQVTKNWFDFLLEETKRRTRNPTSSPLLGKKDVEIVDEELLGMLT